MVVSRPIREGSRVRVGSRTGIVDYLVGRKALVVLDGPEESAVFPVSALSLL